MRRAPLLAKSIWSKSIWSRIICCTLLLAPAGLATAQQPSSSETESVRALIQQARALGSQGKHMEAAQILNRALEFAPNSEEALFEYGKNSLAIGDPVGAMNTLEPLTRMHPTVADYFYLLGVAQLQIGELEYSVESLRHSLELEPQRVLSMIALGMNFNTQKRFAEGKEVLGRSLEIEPDELEALVALAEAEEGLGEAEQAEYHAQRALAGGRVHPGAYFVLGKVRMSEGRFEEARDFFLQTVALSPDAPKGHYQLSLAYSRLADSENSKKYRELYREAKKKETENMIMMRSRAGLGVGGMKG